MFVSLKPCHRVRGAPTPHAICSASGILDTPANRFIFNYIKEKGMKYLSTIMMTLMLGTPAFSADDAGEFVTYEVEGKPYEGYFISPSADAPLILLIHDWDGLTGYEIKRANMLADMGYTVFARRPVRYRHPAH